MSIWCKHIIFTNSNLGATESAYILDVTRLFQHNVYCMLTCPFHRLAYSWNFAKQANKAVQVCLHTLALWELMQVLIWFRTSEAITSVLRQINPYQFSKPYVIYRPRMISPTLNHYRSRNNQCLRLKLSWSAHNIYFWDNEIHWNPEHDGKIFSDIVSFVKNHSLVLRLSFVTLRVNCTSWKSMIWSIAFVAKFWQCKINLYC